MAIICRLVETRSTLSLHFHTLDHWPRPRLQYVQSSIANFAETNSDSNMHYVLQNQEKASLRLNCTVLLQFLSFILLFTYCI